MDFSRHIQENLQKILGEEAQVRLQHPGVAEHGDYSTNVAMTLGGNPKEKAEEIKTKYEELGDEAVERVEVAGPGFVNFFLSKDALLNGLKQFDTINLSSDLKGKTVVVDYSGPNIAKFFSIGHLRSTIIGQAVYNLYSALGAKVIGDNHLGDWGRQFGVLLYQLDKKKLEPYLLGVEELEKLYVEFNEEAKDNPDLWDGPREWFQKLEQGDENARETWKQLRHVSLEEFDRIYKMLGVEIDYSYGESFYEDIMSEVVDECIKKGIAKESQGALIVEFDDMGPAILRKSDDTTNYFTRDLATIKFRLKEWNPDLVIYEVGAEQILHFKQLFKTAERLGWANKEKFYHIPHGLYLSPNGKKFSTRKGDVVRLEDVLLEAVDRAGKLGKTGNEAVARAVGIGAVKYYDLSHQPQSDIVFDWEKVFALEGNSAPYIQYTYARTQSVLAKASPGDVGKVEVNEQELELLRFYYRYSEIIEAAAKSYSPNLLANYLFELAQKYNHFYNTNRILDAGGERKELRLALTSVVGDILKSGLNILGIEAPERM
ncbi:MAG: arginine--tRNA ligase [bacterium]|nr:arginine--tRNA ligase [bacterium]